jgi:hypothetical protein
VPGTITSDQVTIEDAEVVADYLVLGSFASAQALNDDIKVQGVNAINGRVSASTAWSLAAAGGVNLTTGGRHVWQWLRLVTWPSADTKANGGLGISISSDVTPTLTGVSPSNGPTNSKTWYLGGSDTDTTTGWVCYCVDPTSTPDLTIGSPNMATANRVGMRCKVTGTVSNKTLNIHHDVLRYGTGLTVRDGTAGAPVAFVDIETADKLNANAWGVVTQQNGIYFVAGKLYFGTVSQTAITYFKDTDKVVVFPFFPVNLTFYEFLLAGTASFVTTFQLGNYSGGLASGGCTIKGAGNPATAAHAVWTLSASATNTLIKLYGCAFSELRSAALRSDSEVRGCTFNNFASITPNGATMSGCTFQNVKTTAPISGTNALIINAPSEITNITSCAFINCNRAIRITAAGTYNFNGLTFSGNAFDIENTSGGAVIINVSGGSNPTTHTSSGGGSVTINSSVGITLTGLKNPSEVRVYAQGTSTELAGQENVTSGSFVFNVGAGVAVDISILALGYQNMRILNYSTGVDATLPVSQVIDRQYANP